MQFQQAKEFILERLKKELPKNLCYHTLEHVIDVCQAAQNIGFHEHINDLEMKLLLTAALFHDSGFINGSNFHEEESCKLASKHLPDFDYSTAEIEKVNGMIMATKIPQSPKTLLEQIICDADLDYLGRDDFFPISNKLYLELSNAGVVNNENDWNKLQVAFFNSHHYFTNSAIKLRQQKKQEHLLQVEAKIK